jgi:hypothetical protein
MLATLSAPFVSATLVASCSHAEAGAIAADDPLLADALASPDALIDAANPEGGASPGDSTVFTKASTDTASSGEMATNARQAPDGSTGPETCGYTSCAPGTPCPDLTVDGDQLLSSIVIGTRDFAPDNCALYEGCIAQAGTRRLLQFDTATQNIGTADLVLGNPTQNLCFQFSECHQHFHFQSVGRYTLYRGDGVTVAAVGHKQGFCLRDVWTIPTLNPPPPDPAMPYTCDNQGLHVGFEDVYPADVDCQWIDITGVPPGNYVLSVLVNGERYLPESNYGNNEVRVPVTVPAP